MTTHTPGPWHFDRHGYALYVNSGNTLVTALSMDGKPLETSEADARLIAAAPALLEALQWVTRCLERPGPHMDPQAAIERARAAIAAATKE